MNRCRLCNKAIWKEYTDRILFCEDCRKAVEEEIWYKKELCSENEIELMELNDKVKYLSNLVEFKWAEIMKLMRKNLQLNKENRHLKEFIRWQWYKTSMLDKYRRA